MMTFVQGKITDRAVKNLKEFGYPNVNRKNIFTDAIYSEFFRGMLEENKGQGFDADIDGLIARLPNKEAKA